jgi:predicted transcriptional regulator
VSAKPFSALRDRLYADHPESRQRVATKLADLREHRDCTQAWVATAMGTTQSAVSRIERQTDWHVSTLRDFVEATGGQLRLIADYDSAEVEIRPWEAL